MVPDNLRSLIALNPFGWMVNRMRDALLNGSIALEPSDAVAVAVSIVTLIGGLLVFRRLSPHFEDFV
jgi:ABC-type polysaccharide/polyol phosphate export permease